jgi:hypothetical protein
MRDSYQDKYARIRSFIHYALLMMKKTMKKMLIMGKNWVMKKSLFIFSLMP